MHKLRFSIGVGALLGVALVWVSSSVVGAHDVSSRRRIPTPHEVHAYEQVKYVPNSAWACHLEESCVVCKNVSGEPAIVETKALYKRDDYNLRTDTREVREHCVNPGQDFWACLSGYVIEPEPGTAPGTSGDPTTCP